MKLTAFALGTVLCSGVTLCLNYASAGDQPGTTTEKTPAAKAAAPDMADMMKKWEAAATPGPAHQALDPLVGDWEVGSRGKQTGSFPATLGFRFLAGLLTILVLYVSVRLQIVLTTAQSSNVLIVGLMVEAQKIIRWVRWALILLLPPTGTMLCFNLTRRYKEPPSS
jgi:hypothetical protein